jgi:DNA-binding transcriptional LysR family regulator
MTVIALVLPDPVALARAAREQRSQRVGDSGTAQVPVRLCCPDMAPDIAQWRVFLVVAERGSLMKAAEVLHTDQPALSRSLRRLERLLGAQLFLRSSRGLALTEVGRRLHEPVRSLVDQADALESHARAEVRRASGRLRVGTVDVYPMTTAIAEACRDLAVTPDLVSLPWLAHPGAVLDRTIDIGFTMIVDGGLPDASVMRSMPLWDEPDVFALLSDGHPLAASDLVHPRDLVDLPLHLPAREHNPDVHDLVVETLAEAGVTAPRYAPSVGTLATVMGHIAAGNGWMASSGMLADHLAPGIVAKPLAVSLRHTVAFAVIWHVGADPVAVDAFTGRLRDVDARRPTPRS